MIEPTRIQRQHAEALAWRFASVMVCPPEEEGGPVTVYGREHARYAYPRNGSFESPGLKTKAIVTITATGEETWR